jgi:hypothetical protein
MSKPLRERYDDLKANVGVAVTLSVFVGFMAGAVMRRAASSMRNKLHRPREETRD